MSKVNNADMPSTPSARWRKEGKEDPHVAQYDCVRATLVLGDLTDDELANAVYLYADTPPSMSDVISGKAIMPIVYLTAAKDRIRWLSRQNEYLLAQLDQEKGDERY
jgi:hypothetical protein